MADQDDEAGEGETGKGSGGLLGARLRARYVQRAEVRRRAENSTQGSQAIPSAGAAVIERVDDSSFPLVIYRRRPPNPTEYLIYEHLPNGGAEWIGDASSKGEAKSIIDRIREARLPLHP